MLVVVVADPFLERIIGRHGVALPVLIEDQDRSGAYLQHLVLVGPTIRLQSPIRWRVKLKTTAPLTRLLNRKNGRPLGKNKQGNAENGQSFCRTYEMRSVQNGSVILHNAT